MIDLIKEAKKKNKLALSNLCGLYYQKIYTYIYYKVDTREDAEDLTHEVFIRMVNKIDGVGDNFEGWLYQIAKNIVYDYYRKNNRNQEKARELSIVTDVVVNAEEDCFFLDQEQLQAGLKALTQEQQDVVIYRFVQGLSNKIVAQLLGKTEGAVKALQFRAIKNLQNLLKREST